MPETNPKHGVTIAMPLFNSAATLEVSIRSSLNHSCSEFELFPWRGRWWSMRSSEIASALKPCRAQDAKRYICALKCQPKGPI
jgi:hypothetical protein